MQRYIFPGVLDILLIPSTSANLYFHHFHRRRAICSTLLADYIKPSDPPSAPNWHRCFQGITWRRSFVKGTYISFRRPCPPKSKERKECRKLPGTLRRSPKRRRIRRRKKSGRLGGIGKVQRDFLMSEKKQGRVRRPSRGPSRSLPGTLFFPGTEVTSSARKILQPIPRSRVASRLYSRSSSS